MKGVAKYVKCRFIHNVDTQRYDYATKYINNRGVACVVNRENISCMRYLAKECPTHHNVELSEPLLVANSTELCFELQSTTNDHQGHAKGHCNALFLQKPHKGWFAIMEFRGQYFSASYFRISFSVLEFAIDIYHISQKK